MTTRKKVDAPPAAPKKKATRKMLTPAEKVAKLERDLAAAREAEANKDKAAIVKLREERAKLVAKRSEFDVKIKDVDERLQLLGVDTSVVDIEVVSPDEG